jgi:hypothetical protein
MEATIALQPINGVFIASARLGELLTDLGMLP